ncbi:MAG: hypothetical protein KF752_09320 [Pirellulaceae bacterium]|nr:hypothetical protein [Pirellulaceae bacterium]
MSRVLHDELHEFSYRRQSVVSRFNDRWMSGKTSDWQTVATVNLQLQLDQDGSTNSSAVGN